MPRRPALYVRRLERDETRTSQRCSPYLTPMTKRYRAKLSPQAEMRKAIAYREKGLQALDSPLRLGPNTRASRKKPAFLRNLQPKPALGNGRVQKACKRALYALTEASTSEITSWTFATRPSTYRALLRVAVAINRSKKGSGRPIVWRRRIPIPRKGI